MLPISTSANASATFTGILPGDLTLGQAPEVVGAQGVEQQRVWNVVGGPLAVGRAGGEGGVAGPGALAHDVPELVLREREAGRDGDAELLEELLVVVDLVGGGLDRDRPDSGLARGSRAGPEGLAEGLDVLPAHAVREVGQPARRHEF